MLIEFALQPYCNPAYAHLAAAIGLQYRLETRVWDWKYIYISDGTTDRNLVHGYLHCNTPHCPPSRRLRAAAAWDSAED